MKRLFTLGLLILTLLGPSLSVSGNIRERPDMLQSVLASDAIVVGRLFSTEVSDPYVRERWSLMEIEQVLFGTPGAMYLRVAWQSAELKVGPNEYARLIPAPPQLDKLEYHRMLWFLEVESGEWRLLSRPEPAEGVGCEDVALWLADLDRATRDTWRRDLTPGEVLKYEQSILAVRNFIASLECEED